MASSPILVVNSLENRQEFSYLNDIPGYPRTSLAHAHKPFKRG